MATTSDTNTAVEATIALLQARVPKLEEEQAALQSKLAEVTSSLESARTALASLQSLTSELLEADTAADTEPVPVVEAETLPPVAEAPAAKKKTRRARTTAAEKPVKEPGRRSRKAAAATQAAEEPAPAPRKRAARKTTASKASSEATTVGRSGGLSEAVHNALAAASEPLRAKAVLQALGMDETSGNVASVSTTLGRLVNQGRAQRAGRGLFEVASQS